MSSLASGIGTTLSSNYYLRSFYISNRDARTSSKRNGMDNSALSAADSKALRRAIKQLGSFEYSDDREVDIRNTANAFVEIYNNTISSSSASADSSLEHSMKQLKSLAKEYASDLDKIGITVNSDGTLKRRDALFSSAGISKFEKLFASGTNFMQRASSYAKRIERRSDALISTEQHQKLLENSKKNDTSSAEASVSQLFAAGTDLNTVLNTGVGRNVNISL